MRLGVRVEHVRGCLFEPLVDLGDLCPELLFTCEDSHGVDANASSEAVAEVAQANDSKLEPLASLVERACVLHVTGALHVLAIPLLTSYLESDRSPGRGGPSERLAEPDARHSSGGNVGQDVLEVSRVAATSGVTLLWMNTIEHQRLLTISQTADRLNVSTVTVRRLVRRGDLPAVQLGGKGSAVRVAEAELNHWLYANPKMEGPS
jgi:excisionase family DNA binding protein